MGYPRHSDATAKLFVALLQSYESELSRLAEDTISLLSASEVEALESDYQIDALSLKLARARGDDILNVVKDHAEMAKRNMALARRFAA